MLSLEEENKLKADECIEKAEVAFYKGDLEKAERLLTKAERFHETMLAKQILANVQAAKNKGETKQKEMTEQTPKTPVEVEYKYVPDESDVRHAETCIVLAKLAMSKGNYDKAQRFILRSERLHPSEDVKKLLDELEKIRMKKEGTSYNGTCKYGSKEDAEACILLAQDEMDGGNLGRAEKFLLKAERLFSTERAKNLLQQIAEARAKGYEDKDEPKKRPPKKPATPKQEEQLNEKRKSLNEKQMKAIKQINEGKDDYAILGLDKHATSDAVAKAYRKLAAQLHPDRFKTLGIQDVELKKQAASAYLKIGEAKERLDKNQR